MKSNWKDLFDTIFAYNSENLTHSVILNLRMPRVLLTFIIGGMLALSGYLMQLTINNPLAEPYILGTSSAASLGANLVFAGFFPLVLFGIYMPALLAFVFALIATLLVVNIARRNGFVSGSKMLLGGVAMSSLLTAITAFIAFQVQDATKLRTIVFWVMGSFEQAKWQHIPWTFALLIFMTVLFGLLSRHINTLLLGRDRAQDIGLNVKLFNRLTLFSSVLLASVAVTLVGAIGFVGLMIPHVIRAINGVTNKWNIIACVATGGLFIMACDVISKWVHPPVGLPIGIITSFFGVPFFVYLLLKNNYSFE